MKFFKAAYRGYLDKSQLSHLPDFHGSTKLTDKGITLGLLPKLSRAFWRDAWEVEGTDSVQNFCCCSFNSLHLPALY